MVKQEDVKRMKDEVRIRIREGQKTSAISANTGFPLDLIKSVKTEELENDRKLAREKEKSDQAAYMARKAERQHKAFLKKMGYDPDKKPAEKSDQAADNGTVAAPASDAKPEKAKKDK